ncbi:MAG: glycosyl hydrolase family 18 protein [Suipraeoptans sp.]
MEDKQTNRHRTNNPTRQTRAAKRSNRGPRRGQQRKRRRQRNLVFGIVFLIILFIAAIVGLFLWNRYSPTKERADVKEYYGIQNENDVAVVIDNEVAELKGKLEDGKMYVRYETVQDAINQRFYWDANENLLLYTLPDSVVSVSVGSKEYSVSKERNTEDYVILKTEGSTAYIALDFVKQYTNISYEVFSGPNRVVIDKEEKVTTAESKSDTQVRVKAGVKSPILSDVSKKDVLNVIETQDDWKKVRTSDGYIGYVKGNVLKDSQETSRERTYTEPEFSNISKDYTINMAWHNVTNQTTNDSVLSTIANTQGLTTILPTWFHVADTNGTLSSIASNQYVNYCHQSNIEVWATLRDFDGGISSTDETYELLSFTSKRENLINQVISEVLQYGIDGINLDFEKISTECAVHYIQFVRELSVKCRQNGIVFSIDNYVPKAYNAHYNRAEQGIFADYVVIMGYDEHWGGSPTAGPVSSIPFVKEGIEETIKEVPADKTIIGINFYTRLWEETPKSDEELAEQEGTEAADYPTNVTSTAYGMAAAQQVLADNGAEITFDEDAGQNYATWIIDNTTYKIWIEDEQSIESKLKLMKENNLAGTAFWALGQENSNVWNLVIKYIN